MARRRHRLALFSAAFVACITAAPFAHAQEWLVQSELLTREAKDGAGLGSSVAVSGDIALVAAGRADGGAYVFGYSAGKWLERQRIAAPSGSGALAAVALAGNNAFLARADGSVHVFERVNGAFAFVQTLVSSPAVLTPYSVALAAQTDTLVEGVATESYEGPVYVFVRGVDGKWTQQATLASGTGDKTALYGGAVAIDGDTVVVGASEANGGCGTGCSMGAAYVFQRTGTAWSLEATLHPSGVQPESKFGTAVAVRGDRAMVGAPSSIGAQLDGGVPSLEAGVPALGVVFSFTRSGGAWANATPLGDALHVGLGSAIAMSPANVIVSEASQPGSTPNFAVVSPLATPTLTTLDPHNVVAGDDFGESVAIDGTTAIVGAPKKTLEHLEQGAAYVFRFGKKNGVTCAATADCASGFCVDGVCCNSECGGGLGGDCQACDMAHTGSNLGECRTIVVPQICHVANPGGCDTATTCDGVNPTCPADVAKPNGTSCGGSGVCNTGMCLFPDAGAPGIAPPNIAPFPAAWDSASSGKGCDVTAVGGGAGGALVVAACVGGAIAWRAGRRRKTRRNGATGAERDAE